MNHRTTAIAATRGVTRSVWALLAVLWLNMAVLPCAMAFQSDDHDCPHCPPADEHAMAGHHGHGQDKSQAGESCATSQSQCCDLTAATVDTRSDKVKVRDASDVEFFAVPAIAVFSPWPAAHETAAADPPDPPGNFRPLHALYCVYLD